MGTVLALCSVILVTAAQLMLRWSMMRIQHIDTIALWHDLPLQPVLVLAAGLLAYVLSMIFWLLALRRLPLSRAYPLLGLSYVLVWLLAISLPWFSEPFHAGALAGVVLIMLGLICICIKPGNHKR